MAESCNLHELEAEYLKYGGKNCLYCKTPDSVLATGELQHEQTSIFQQCKCVVCKREWVDCYQLNGISEVEELPDLGTGFFVPDDV